MCFISGGSSGSKSNNALGKSTLFPWNYIQHSFGPPPDTVKELVVPAQWQRVLLVHGFGRENYDNDLPTDVVSACLDMFGLDGFAFKVNTEHLQQSHFFQSNVFCCNDVHFQVIFRRKTGGSSLFGGSNNVDPDRVHVYVRFMDPLHQRHKLIRMVARFSICGHETFLNAQFQQRGNTQATQCELEVDALGTWLHISDKDLVAESKPRSHAASHGKVPALFAGGADTWSESVKNNRSKGAIVSFCPKTYK